MIPVSAGFDSMRIAYIILSYNLPQQLRGLVKMLDTAESTSVVFVHHDAKSPPLPDDFISGFAKTRLAPRRFAVTWGDFSQVEALVSCLRAVVDTVEFDWIVVLSGQDFPCRPIGHFVEFSLPVASMPSLRRHRSNVARDPHTRSPATTIATGRSRISLMHTSFLRVSLGVGPAPLNSWIAMVC